MDNHRAASWCWLQHVAVDGAAGLLHIDAHYDLLDSRTNEWTNQFPEPFDEVSLEDYLDREFIIDGLSTPVIRWDNYIPILARKCPGMIKRAYFATQCRGNPKEKTKKELGEFYEVAIWELPANMGYWITDYDGPWIVNLDLDYFVFDCPSEDEQGDEKKLVLMSDEYIRAIAREIQRHRDRIDVLTICFSPECCGGWKEAERLWSTVDGVLGTGLTLPP